MKSKKLWMTLIEILIVVGIIWVIAWIALPKVSNSKLESRDILRISQIQEIGAAITSYGIDHWGYPISTGTCISSLTELVDEWYLSRIDPDPNNERIITYCDINQKQHNICPEWYYNYVSDGSWFVLAAYMEDNKNWNYICLNTETSCHDITTDKDHLCQDLAALWSWWDLAEFLSSNRLNDSLKSHIYVYLRQ
jgi:type II secretory pathway pseudopilin PulG